MRLLIVEDEVPAATRLQKMLQELIPDAHIVDVLDAVEDAVAWFKCGTPIDLAFMDIQLADGLSMDIFKQVKVDIPVIFTTAYDQYALSAFKANGIDYLLKPIDPAELRQAIDKFHALKTVAPSDAIIAHLLRQLQAAQEPKRYRERFLVKTGELLRYVPAQDAAYFFADMGYVTLVTHEGHRWLLDQSIEQLAATLDPKTYFQVSRQCIVGIKAIGQIHSWFNSRLRLYLSPECKEEVVVARDRVKGFKHWLDR